MLVNKRIRGMWGGLTSLMVTVLAWRYSVYVTQSRMIWGDNGQISDHETSDFNNGVVQKIYLRKPCLQSIAGRLINQARNPLHASSTGEASVIRWSIPTTERSLMFRSGYTWGGADDVDVLLFIESESTRT